MKYLLSLTTLLSLLILLPQQVHAASNCKPIYNGGVTTQQLCNGTVASPFDNTPQTNNLPQQNTAPRNTILPKASPTPFRMQPGTTKGGLTVQPVAPGKTTPSTGPELFGLLGLFPAGALGYYLRKKA